MKTVCPGLTTKGLSLLAASTLSLFLWSTAVSVKAVAQVDASERPANQSRFHRTVQYLQDASPRLRGEFSAIALTHLIDGYQEEARLARAELRAAGAHARLRGWSLAVNRYASQISLLLDDIALGLPVRLISVGETSVAITVTNRMMILSHPRLEQQHFLEHEILADFCASYRCDQFTPLDTEPAPLFASSIYVRPDWMFTERGPICSYQGIKVYFKSGSNLGASRVICKQFLQEVIALTNELSWQRGLAVPIQWSALEIQPGARKAEHIVRLNVRGDTAAVNIPLLYGNPRLLGHILPWIREWMADPHEASIQLEADHYGWE
ncbi:MAG: hypothetical protein ACJ04P_09150 [Halioglobus sp.]